MPVGRDEQHAVAGNLEAEEWRRGIEVHEVDRPAGRALELGEQAVEGAAPHRADAKREIDIALWTRRAPRVRAEEDREREISLAASSLGRSVSPTVIALQVITRL